jgi:excisionase family DNA binding protein
MGQKKNLPVDNSIKSLLKLVLDTQLEILGHLLMQNLWHDASEARLSKQLPIKNKDKLFYTTEDVMEMLRISRRTLQTLRNDGKIGFVKVYNTIRFSKEDIERFKVEARGEE